MLLTDTPLREAAFLLLRAYFDVLLAGMLLLTLPLDVAMRIGKAAGALVRREQPQPQFTSVLVTGASQGIGAGLARRYAAPGVTLWLTATRRGGLEATAAECRKRGATVFERYVDVRSKSDMEALVAEANREKPLDLVIANAGVAPKSDGLVEAADVVNINVSGAVHTVVPAVEHMLRLGVKGHIVLMSSLGGLTPSNAMLMAPYAMSKQALRAYGESLRTVLRAHEIGVTVIYPGMTESRMVSEQQAAGIFMVTGVTPIDEACEEMARCVAANVPEVAYPTAFYIVAKMWGSVPSWFRDLVPLWLLKWDPYLQWETANNPLSARRPSSSASGVGASSAASPKATTKGSSKTVQSAKKKAR